MQKKLLLMLFLNISILISLYSQEMPLVYEVENTGEDFPIPYLPAFSELPNIEALPDPFEWSDGRGRISNFSDWLYRRAEIKAEVEHYEIGKKPDRPDTITASYSDGTLTVNVTVNGKILTLSSSVILPSGEGPFPAIIGMNSPSGSIPADMLSSRNIARITYSHNQVTTYGSQNNSDPYYQLYPHLNATNTGQYSAWAWGVSRLIDGLELVQEDLPIDLQHIAVTGCSYAGKMALFSGALDERIALTLSIESGGGGYTTWRFSETLGNVEKLGSTDHNWFKEDMWQFSGNNVSKLPHDHHELMTMVAPRALFVTGNPDYVWLADESGYVGSKAAKEVWKALGIPDRFGYSIIAGHSHCAIPGSQLPEIEVFLDKFLLGIDTVNTNVATSPYNTNLTPWITWTTPELSNGTSFFGKASLIYPSNLQKSLDTSITFTWNQVEDAEKYFFQLSTDATFKNYIENDSTADTSITIDGLLKGKRYYWRIQTKSVNGLGPYSMINNFSTFIPIPSNPEIISAVQYPDRYDYFTFTWRKADNAEKYIIELSHGESFATIFKKDSIASDTVITLSGFSEGRKEYWRVLAKNIEGSSSWTQSSLTVKLKTPESLVIQKNDSNDITLSWEDESSREDGYIIERKQSSDTSFTLVDSLEKNFNTYIDTTVIVNQTYTYRVKAYNSVSESDYSNEASLNITDIKEFSGIPTDYTLSQNYPNPFNPSTRVKFSLPQVGLTKIIIYDIVGREIKTLLNKVLDSGYYEININVTDVPSGVYFYRLQSGDFIQTRKMILMK